MIAWALLTQLDLGDTTRNVVILMAGMPAAVNTTILARQLGFDTALSARIVVVSTGCSVISITAMLGLIA